MEGGRNRNERGQLGTMTLVRNVRRLERGTARQKEQTLEVNLGTEMAG